MKKQLITLAFCLLGTSSLFAQPENQKLVEIGALAGLNVSRLNTNTSDIDTYSSTGYLVGGLLRLNIGNLYAQPELLFSVKGSELRSGNSDRVKVDFQNVEIPLIVGFKVFNKKNFNLRVMGGPSASYAVNIKGDANFDNADDYFKRGQWNVQLGAGVDILFLTLDVRYEWGLNDLRTAQGSREAFDEAVQNRNLRLSLGVKF
ncbi:MAG: PorT family protein [Bacteroidetes bacterium]|nr:PorT family protein [Bacteroidota bacterium]